MTSHDVGVDVDRINRIGDRDPVLVAKNIENVTAIAFRTVGEKDFVVCNLDPALRDNRCSAIFCAQKFVTLLVSITAKCFANTELIDRLVHRRDGGGWQWLGDIADAAPDQSFGGIGIRLTDIRAPAVQSPGRDIRLGA